MAQIEFIQKSGRDIFEQSKKKFAGTPFRLITEWGEVLILPTSFAQEIRNEESLSFGKTVEMVAMPLHSVGPC
jgi:cytochrome P450 monooxygenase-2